LFSSAAVSCLHFSLNLHPTYTFLSSTYQFVWVCKPAYSVCTFYPIWPPKITENRQIQNSRKSKNKTLIFVDLDPLMTNLTLFRSSGMQFAVKITEITDILNVWYQLFNTHSLSDRGWSQSEIIWKTSENISFSQIIPQIVDWGHNG